MDERDDREQLYNRFINEVKSGKGLSFYDEDDLIEIYNFADDSDDDFGRAEVLFAMSRLYPDSRALLIRKALFFHQTGNFDSAAALVEKMIPESLYERIIKVRVGGASSAERKSQLKNIIKTASKFDENEIIQLCDLAEDVGEVEWLFAHRDEIVAKCIYKPTFLYDLVNLATLHGNKEVAVQAAEEMTALEPLNLDFWEMYARACFDFGEYEEALTACDYALAIDSSSAEAAEIRMLSEFNLDSEKFLAGCDLNALARLVKDNPDNTQLTRLLVGAYMVRNKTDKAVSLLKKSLERMPLNPEYIEMLLRCSPADGIKALEVLLNEDTGLSEEAVIGWAERLRNIGDYSMVASILYAYDRIVGLTFGRDMLFEACYRAENYPMVILAFAEVCGDEAKNVAESELISLSANTLLTVMLSYFRFGDVDKALKAGAQILACLRGEPITEPDVVAVIRPFMLYQGLALSHPVLIANGLAMIVTALIDAINKPDASQAVDRLDPFK